MKWVAPASGSTFAGCSLYRTGASQSYASNTQVVVTFNNEDFDTDAYHNNSTNTSRITIPSGKGGKYRFFYRGFVTSYSSANYINVNWLKNGSDIGTAAVNYPNTTWSEGYHFGELIIDLAVADYIEVAVNQASGLTKDMRTDADYYQRFYCIYLGA